MKNFRRLSVIMALLVIVGGTYSFLPRPLVSESKYSTKAVSISIKGTSSLHDWEMTSASGKCDAELVTSPANKFSSLKSLSFTIPATSLKSGHNLMDKNTYKALKTGNHPNISFVLSKSSITQTSANNYKVNCTGILTIAGASHETDLTADGKWNASDKSFQFTGTKKMKMTDYNVKPPTVMMGTIKTGNDISITYNLSLTNK